MSQFSKQMDHIDTTEQVVMEQLDGSMDSQIDRVCSHYFFRVFWFLRQTDVNALIQQVADENQMELTGEFAAIPQSVPRVQAKAAAQQPLEADLEARLNQLLAGT